MKRVILIALILVIALSFKGYALEIGLLDMRGKIFQESKQIKPLLVSSKNAVLVSSMWDSCLIAVTQLDAYFSMVGIFNTVKQKDWTESSFNYLITWLNEIKSTNSLNIKSLSGALNALEPDVKRHIERLISYFNELNRRIDSDLAKISTLKKSLATKENR